MTSVTLAPRSQVIDFKDARLKPTGARPICARHVQIGADVVLDDWEEKLLEQGKIAAHWLGLGS
jgi:O-methyltransferase involved in polyketide biosynthesis